jgi:hypothetical protein
MEKVLLAALLVTILYCLLKLVEMKYLDKEMKPLKFLIRDAVIVFVSATAGIFGLFYANGSLSEFYNIVTETKTINPAATQVFTGEPEF